MPASKLPRESAAWCCAAAHPKEGKSPGRRETLQGGALKGPDSCGLFPHVLLGNNHESMGQKKPIEIGLDYIYLRIYIYIYIHICIYVYTYTHIERCSEYSGPPYKEFLLGLGRVLLFLAPGPAQGSPWYETEGPGLLA